MRSDFNCLPPSVIDILNNELTNSEEPKSFNGNCMDKEHVSHKQNEKRSAAPIERLPQELFDQIIPYLYVEGSTSASYRGRNKDLISCLCVSQTIHQATLSTLLKNVNLLQANIFSKFLRHVQARPWLGDMVRRLDFSRFSSVGLGRSAHMNSVVPDLTSKTLLQCLELTPNLQEFLVCEHLEKDFSPEVVDKLFVELGYLEAIDFCAASSSEFTNAMTSVIRSDNPRLPQKLPLRRLGFHDCTTLPALLFDTLLPRLPQITHLDLSHTPVTDATLSLINPQAKITHLSLSKCLKLTGDGTVEFLTNHPAVNSSLVHLNLFHDSTRFRLLSHKNVEDLLPQLPESLVSLNISGARIDSHNLPMVLPLMSHLEELSIGGAELTLHDINSLVAPSVRSKVQYLDLSGIAALTPSTFMYTRDCSLLLPTSQPLQVIELSEKMVETLTERPQNAAQLGWSIRTKGRRGWFVRMDVMQRHPDPDAFRARKTSFGMRRMSNEHDLPDGMNGVCSDNLQDVGYRSWKLGDRYWGARKISCSWGETGGIYAYYGYGKR